MAVIKLSKTSAIHFKHISFWCNAFCVGQTNEYNININ